MKTFEEVMVLTRTVSSNTALEDPEAKALYECCLQVSRNGTVVEIGCECGRASSLIIQMAKECGFYWYHIDPYIKHPKYEIDWLGTMWSIDVCFGFVNMTSKEAINEVPAIIDLLFIDGDHSYDAVLSDLTLYCPRLRTGGVLTMHDFGRDSLPDVYRAATEYLKDDEWDQVQVAGTLGVWRRR